MRSYVGVNAKGVGELFHEPRVAHEAPRDVAIHRLHDPLVHGLLATQVLVYLLSTTNWASVVKHTNIHGNLHLLDEAVVHDGRLGVLLRQVVGVVLLEPPREGCLRIGAHSLDRVVGKTADQPEGSDERLRAFVFDQLLLLRPVVAHSVRKSVDLVLKHEVPVLFVVGKEVLLVRAVTRSEQNCRVDVLVVPLRDETHSSENLCSALRVTDISHFFIAIALTNLCHGGWEVVEGVFAPVHGPVLFVVGCPSIVLLRVLDS